MTTEDRIRRALGERRARCPWLPPLEEILAGWVGGLSLADQKDELRALTFGTETAPDGVRMSKSTMANLARTVNNRRAAA